MCHLTINATAHPRKTSFLDVRWIDLGQNHVEQWALMSAAQNLLSLPPHSQLGTHQFSKV